jgi:hypothetical protein
LNHPFIKNKLEEDEKANKKTMKTYNFNKYGRYNGGVPNKIGKARGGAINMPGEVVSALEMHMIRGAGTSVDIYTNREDMRANTNFYKSDKEKYNFKTTYFQTKIENFALNPSRFSYTVLLVLILGAFLYFDHKKTIISNENRIKAFQTMSKRGQVDVSDGFVILK